MAIQKHFLVVSIQVQGHINPARSLSRHLARCTGAKVTLATPTSAHLRMFPSAAGHDVDENLGDGHSISYTHYPDTLLPAIKLPESKLLTKESISRLAGDLAARGQPITCIIYTFLLPIVADVARDLGIPSVLFWIQTAAVFDIYDCYFHGYADIITAHGDDPSFMVDLPGLPRIQIRDLPSFLSTPIAEDKPFSFLYFLTKDAFDNLDRELAASSKPRILVNTFEELEADVISSIQGTEIITVGPLVFAETEFSGDVYENDSKGYMEWLDSKPEQSVVYVSFGSLAKTSRRQMKEIAQGLVESGRPYLWVSRRDNKVGEEEEFDFEGGGRGMVVEWCSQVRVLSHRSIGCFVTHCGWNSMIESIACGVPMVMVPGWSDQAMNARMAEGEWGTGVRAEMNGEGVLEGKELRRCLDAVMGDEGVEIRMKAGLWMDKARETLGEGGSSYKNLKAFVESFSK